MFSKTLLITSLLISFIFAANLNNTSEVNHFIKLKINNSITTTIKLKENNTTNSKKQSKDELKDLEKKVLKDSNNEFGDYLIGSITNKKNKEISIDVSSNPSNDKNNTRQNIFDKLRLKIIEQLKEKKKIFSSAVFTGSLIYQSDDNPTLNRCTSLSKLFSQYTHFNAFLIVAFLLFPVAIPLYLFRFFIMLVFKAVFCPIGIKRILRNVVYNIRNF